MLLAESAWHTAAAAASATTREASHASTHEHLKDVARVDSAHAASLTGVDVLKVVALVVQVTLLLVEQNLLGFVDVAEHLLRLGKCLRRVTVFVRMPLEGHLLVPFLDLRFSGALVNAKDLVVVLALGLFGAILGIYQLSLDVETTRVIFACRVVRVDGFVVLLELDEQVAALNVSLGVARLVLDRLVEGLHRLVSLVQLLKANADVEQKCTVHIRVELVNSSACAELLNSLLIIASLEDGGGLLFQRLYLLKHLDDKQAFLEVRVVAHRPLQEVLAHDISSGIDEHFSAPAHKPWITIEL